LHVLLGILQGCTFWIGFRLKRRSAFTQRP
jgi:hypothetical protein